MNAQFLQEVLSGDRDAQAYARTDADARLGAINTPLLEEVASGRRTAQASTQAKLNLVEQLGVLLGKQGARLKGDILRDLTNAEFARLTDGMERGERATNNVATVGTVHAYEARMMAAE